MKNQKRKKSLSIKDDESEISKRLQDISKKAESHEFYESESDQGVRSETELEEEEIKDCL